MKAIIIKFFKLRKIIFSLKKLIIRKKGIRYSDIKEALTGIEL